MSIYCLHCSSIISHPKKFCNSSCSAKHNNKGVRRHGKAPALCEVCDERTSRTHSRFCSRTCFSISRRVTEHQKKSKNAASQSRYRAKMYRVLSPTADKEIIKQIYLNCPKGHEVDHIIPLSKGGLHHEDNLQYLLKEDNRRKGNRMVLPPGFEPGTIPL